MISNTDGTDAAPASKQASKQANSPYAMPELIATARARRVKWLGADVVPKTRDLERLAARTDRDRDLASYVDFTDALLVALEFAITHPVEPQGADRDAVPSPFDDDEPTPNNALPDVLRREADHLATALRSQPVYREIDARLSIVLNRLANRIEGTR